jgi:hypothetical protein
MTWGAIIGGGLALVGGAVGSKGAKDAAKEQSKGGDAAIAEQRRQYDIGRQDLAPYRETGTQALGSIARGLGLPGYSAPGTTAPLSFEEWSAANPQPQLSPVAARVAGRITGHPAADPNAAYQTYVAGFKPTQTATTGDQTPVGDFNRDFTAADFVKDPGYQFRMDEGRNALEGSAAASGGLFSGATGRRLERYGQDYASGEYSNAYSRFNNDRTTRFNRLATIAGVGQTATNTGIAAGENASNNISDTIIGQANSAAAGRVGQANAVTGGLQTLGNYYLNRRFGSQPPPPTYSGSPRTVDSTIPGYP